MDRNKQVVIVGGTLNILGDSKSNQTYTSDIYIYFFTQGMIIRKVNMFKIS